MVGEIRKPILPHARSAQYESAREKRFAISAIAASALLLVNSCLAAAGPEAAQEAKTPLSPASLAAALNSTNAATRFYAIESPGKIAGSATVDLLAKALHDSDVCVRIAAAKALGRTGDPVAMAALANVLKTETNADAWNMAAKPLLEAGSAAIPSLLEVLWHAETLDGRAFAVNALSAAGWEPKTPDEKMAYYMVNLDEYSEEMSALGPVAIPAMKKILADENGKYRVAAVWVLGGIKDSRVFMPLVKALVDPSPDVRRAARVTFRGLGFDSVTKHTGITGYLLLLACRFLVPLVYAATKVFSYFRHRHNGQSGSSKGCATIGTFAKALLSINLLFVFSCIASLLVFYLYTNQYIKAKMSFDLLMYDPLVIIFPAIVMIFVLDLVSIVYRAAGMIKGEPGKALCMARTLLWGRRIFVVLWGAGVLYYFACADFEYAKRSNGVKRNAEYAKSAAAYVPKKDTLSPEAEALKFASIGREAKEATKTIDARYLDQQQKEQVVDTLVRLVSIRSPSKEEARIKDALAQVMENLGAREIDCRKGDPKAPFNLVMEFPATEDLKDAPGILLNAHMDTIDQGRCTPQGLEFDKVKKNFYHRDNGSFGADDKCGVTMIVEALRTLKRDFWDKGYSHRRVLAVLTAREELGCLGAEYLAAHCRELFDNIDFSFTADGLFKQDEQFARLPHITVVYKNKFGSFKAKQVGAIMEKFAKERNSPFKMLPARDNRVDATRFPPEAYKVVFFMVPVHGEHKEERVNVGELIDSVDMLVNVVEQLDVDYVRTVGPVRDGHTKTRSPGTGMPTAQLRGVAFLPALLAVAPPEVVAALVMLMLA